MKIKRKSWLWHLVPLSGRNRFSATIGETIYLSPKRYDDSKRLQPKASTIALIEHEKVHVLQFRRDRLFPFKYLFSRKWRLKYEAEAYARHIEVLVKRGNRDREKEIDKKARLLASRSYMLFMNYETVREAISEAKFRNNIT